MLAGARINDGVAGYDDVFLGYTDRLQTRPRSIDRDRDTHPRGLAKLILFGEVVDQYFIQVAKHDTKGVFTHDRPTKHPWQDSNLHPLR